MTKQPYPPYNAAAACPKCGGGDIATTWGGANYYYWARKYLDEHMRRMCRRCRYEWLESPLALEPHDGGVA